MIEVLLFSFSISIDAFGYSLGFGSRNIKLGKVDFLILNLINSSILTFFLLIFSSIKNLLNASIIEKISPICLLLFGVYYVYQSFYKLFKSLKQKSKNKISVIGEDELSIKTKKHFMLSDLLLLLTIFVFENIFSCFVFYTSLSGGVFFVLTNFIFHFMFFTIGFDLGNKIVKKIDFNSSFISGFIFCLLGILNL